METELIEKIEKLIEAPLYLSRDEWLTKLTSYAEEVLNATNDTAIGTKGNELLLHLSVAKRRGFLSKEQFKSLTGNALEDIFHHKVANYIRLAKNILKNLKKRK